MYYDVVCSIYEESDDGFDYRIDSHLICGGFKTEDDALEYINTHDCKMYSDIRISPYACVEIEAHKADGSVAGVITVAIE